MKCSMYTHTINTSNNHSTSNKMCCQGNYIMIASQSGTGQLMPPLQNQVQSVRSCHNLCNRQMDEHTKLHNNNNNNINI